MNRSTTIIFSPEFDVAAKSIENFNEYKKLIELFQISDEYVLFSNKRRELILSMDYHSKDFKQEVYIETWGMLKFFYVQGEINFEKLIQALLLLGKHKVVDEMMRLHIYFFDLRSKCLQVQHDWSLAHGKK